MRYGRIRDEPLIPSARKSVVVFFFFLKADPAEGSGGALKWFEQQRQAWIAEMLQVYGFINRAHLQRKFGISQPQASMDLQRFLRAHPSAARYDATRKCYVSMRRKDLETL
jgi:hypothetical protein